jgi:hypothetical protein
VDVRNAEVLLALLVPIHEAAGSMAISLADDGKAISLATSVLANEATSGKGQCWDGAVSMCVSCKCFKLGVQGCPCVSGTRNPCYDPAMNCEINPGSPSGSTGACWYP